MNDADLETAELVARGNDIANGVCPTCEEALDPLLPKWAGSYTRPEYTAEMAAASAGPVHPSQPYHQWCWDALWAEASR